MITSGGTATLGLYDNISEIRKKADITYVDAKASDLQQTINSLAGGHVGYTTLALANAATSTLAPNTLVEVTNDTTTANNGLYLWNGTTLTKSAYDPLTQSKIISEKKLAKVSLNFDGYEQTISSKVSSLSASGFVNNDGTIGASELRKYRSISLVAGETAFYSGYLVASGTTYEAVNCAIFASGSGVEIIEKAALALGASQYYKGQFTATESGTLYVNQTVSATLNPENGSLVAGVIGETIIKKSILANSLNINDLAVSKDMYARDIQTINGGNDFIELTHSVDFKLNEVLYKNGSTRTFISGVAEYDQWGTAYIPVRAGDVIKAHIIINDVSTSDERMFLAQLDTNRRFITELTKPTSVTGWQDLEATATQNGYIAVRVRVRNASATFDYKLYRKAISVIAGKVAAIETSIDVTVVEKAEELVPAIVDAKLNGKGVNAITIIDSQLEKIPKRLSMDHAYNSQTYTQNNIVKTSTDMYMVGIDELRKPFIMKRSLLGGAWSVFDLSTVVGNPLSSPFAEDSHNNIVIAITKDGYIIVTGNHHVNTCRAVISNNPNDITSWSAISYTSGTVTYPRLLKHPDGTIQAFWRQGDSGGGEYYTAVFNDVTRTFNTAFRIIGGANNLPVGATTSAVYENGLAIDKTGTIHIAWGYRTQSSSAVANFGLFYAKSADKGQTWMTGANVPFDTLPLRDTRSEKIYTVNINEGYVNQNGGCVDLNNNYHTALWHSDPVTGNSRIIHIWFDGLVWRNEVVFTLDRPYPPSASMLPGYFSRPLIVCSQSGKLFIVYKNSYENPNQIRAIDVTTTDAPVDFGLLNFGTLQTELATNIDFPMFDNELVFLLSKGGGNTTNTIWKNQSAYLVTVPLPV